MPASVSKSLAISFLQHAIEEGCWTNSWPSSWMLGSMVRRKFLALFGIIIS